jgi:hypothetical protein
MDGDSERVNFDDIGIFCSLMCFVPWAQFIAVPSPDDDDILSEKSDQSEDDGSSMMPHWNTAQTTRSRVPTARPVNVATLDTEGWSVFNARRRNSLDGSRSSGSDLSSSSSLSSPHYVSQKQVPSRHRNSPPGVADLQM